MVYELKDKVILITGASQGLGEEVAYAYARQGATVILLGRNNKNLERVYDNIVAENLAEPYAISFDLFTAKEQEYNQLAVEIMKNTGRLDGIVHCAAYFYAYSPFEFQEIEEWADQYRINTIAPLALTRAFSPVLLQSEDASVIFVSESHSETPQAYMGGFGASKAALNYAVSCLADEWSRHKNLRANILIPGVINSPQRKKTHPGESAVERKAIAEVLPQFIHFMSAESKGKTGNTVYI